MKTKQWWLAAVAVLALAPAGLRMLTWQGAREATWDPADSDAGRALFVHQWTPNDPLAKGGDGLGPVFNAASCAECHKDGGLGGAGGLKHNVTIFTVLADRDPKRINQAADKAKEGVVHARGVGVRESLADVDANLPAIFQPTLDQIVALPGHRNSCIPLPRNVSISQRNTPALFGAKLIEQIPDRAIIANERAQRIKWGMTPIQNEERPVGRALRMSDGRVGRFGWKAQTAGLADFVQAACANELGLGNPGMTQPKPLSKQDYRTPGLDLTLEQCNQLTAFVASLPQPVERLPEDPLKQAQAIAGKKHFSSVGCADCHTPKLGDVEGIYSDLLLHRMGQDLVGGGTYGEPPPNLPSFPPGEAPGPDEWRTPPLWAVADTAPYLHDGRASTLEDAIRLHRGQGTRSADRFAKLSPAEQKELVAFLKTLRAPEATGEPPAAGKQFASRN